MKYLGETFDIHAGGIDLVFPHHENEIAQSEGATGKKFARYWLHAEHLKVEGESMSKTRGNYYTFRDLRDKGFDPFAIRYLLLSVPYNKQLNFTFDGLRGAEKTVESLRAFRARVKSARCEPGSSPFRGRIKWALDEFEAGMDDDLNTSAALAAIHDLKREVNTEIDKCWLKEEDRLYVLEFIEKVNSVFNIFPEEQAVLLDV
jgi:cysteinyl-tRNA synthetase